MTFDQKVIRNGRITVGLACIANFLPALYVGLHYGVQPSISVLLQLYGALAATYGITWIIQPIAYYPTMGAAGSYIGWLAGSCGDIRMPAAAMAQKIVGVEAGTHEGDVIGTMGVACSVFVSASLITLFVIIGNQVIPMLPPFITGSFSYILPSLFGAIFVDNARKNLKAGLITFVAGVALLYFGKKIGMNSAIINILVIAVGIGVSRLIYVQNRDKAAAAK